VPQQFRVSSRKKTVTALYFNQSARPNKLKEADFVQSFARGLLVIQSFDGEHRRQTSSDVARRTGLNRATVRRLLLTLEDLGYVRVESRQYSLAPSVLRLGYAYISALRAPTIAQPYLESLAEEIDESCSMTVLDGTEVVYVARVPTHRIFSLALGVGSRLPAFMISMGRVLLAELPEDELDALLAASDLIQATRKTIVDPLGIKRELEIARKQGWYLLDEELELGIRGVAAPIRDETGRVVAAINVSTTSARTTKKMIQATIVPPLLRTASDISAALEIR